MLSFTEKQTQVRNRLIDDIYIQNDWYSSTDNLYDS